jgi:hypothetical protein
MSLNNRGFLIWRGGREGWAGWQADQQAGRFKVRLGFGEIVREIEIQRDRET